MMVRWCVAAVVGMGGGGVAVVIRQEKQSRTLSVSYLPAVSGTMLGWCGATQRRLPSVGESPSPSQTLFAEVQ